MYVGLVPEATTSLGSQPIPILPTISILVPRRSLHHISSFYSYLSYSTPATVSSVVTESSVVSSSALLESALSSTFDDILWATFEISKDPKIQNSCFAEVQEFSLGPIKTDSRKKISQDAVVQPVEMCVDRSAALVVGLRAGIASIAANCA